MKRLFVISIIISTFVSCDPIQVVEISNNTTHEYIIEYKRTNDGEIERAHLHQNESHLIFLWGVFPRKTFDEMKEIIKA